VKKSSVKKRAVPLVADTMFEHVQKIKGPVLALKITGEITENEHEQIDRLLSAHISQWGRIRLFLTVKHYASFSSAEALYEDLRMVKLHSENIERMAVVGDRPWKSTWVGLFGLFSRLETDYFEMHQIEEAWQWITEGITTVALQ
jgi:hypothetical protein